MKELSIEQKAKAYDELKVKAQELTEDGYIDKLALLDLFPELKESEDEKLRKAIVATIHLYYGEPLEDEAKEMIAWIEKQGEQILANSAKTCKDEQEPTDEEMKTLLRTEYEKGRADTIAEMQKPAWSEEDEEFLRRAINATKDVYPMTAKWLKFLKDRVQPKQEWSKKDNQYLCGLIGLIEQSKAELPITLKGKAADNCIDWLKSLRHQNTWKPSDEQIKAIRLARSFVTDDFGEHPTLSEILIELEAQLKKLK